VGTNVRFDSWRPMLMGYVQVSPAATLICWVVLLSFGMAAAEMSRQSQRVRVHLRFFKRVPKMKVRKYFYPMRIARRRKCVDSARLLILPRDIGSSHIDSEIRDYINTLPASAHHLAHPHFFATLTLEPRNAARATIISLTHKLSTKIS